MNKDIDQKIRDALRAEDDELAAFFDETPSIFDQVADTFKGSWRFLNIISFVFTFFIFAFSIICLVYFFRTDPGEVKTMLAWGAGFVWASMAVGLLKMWFWMEMQRNQITRETTRVELELAALARRLYNTS